MAQDLVDFEDIYQAVESEVDNASTSNETTIKKFINRIYRKALSKILQLNRDYFLTKTTFSTTANTKTYTWSGLSITDILLPVAVTDSNDDPLRVGSVREDVEEIFWIGNTGIGFSTTPSSAETYNLWYIQRKSDLSAVADVPSIEQIHFDVLYWGACYLFYVWRKNKEMATFYKAFFEEAWNDFIGFHTTRPAGDRVVSVDDGLA